MWHKTYQRLSCSPSRPYFESDCEFSFNPSSMLEESECDGLSSDLRYLQITLDHRTSTLHGIDHAPKVKNFSIKRGGKLSLQSDVVDILVCTTIVVGSNRAQQLQAPCAASSYSRSDAGRYWSTSRRLSGAWGDCRVWSHTWSIGSDWRALLPGGQELTTIGSCCGYIRG